MAVVGQNQLVWRRVVHINRSVAVFPQHGLMILLKNYEIKTWQGLKKTKKVKQVNLTQLAFMRLGKDIENSSGEKRLMHPCSVLCKMATWPSWAWSWRYRLTLEENIRKFRPNPPQILHRWLDGLESPRHRRNRPGWPKVQAHKRSEAGDHLSSKKLGVLRKNVQHWILIIMERIGKRKTLNLKDKGSLEKPATEPPASGWSGSATTWPSASVL